MSEKGNRSQPNGVRVDGKPDMTPENPNRSDITDQTQADAKSVGGRAPMMTGGPQGGPHQESRDHNKHNNGGQSGHKPQAHHSPAEEKH